jgi:single-stranded DNA-specific DHH superfamily exonuclease
LELLHKHIDNNNRTVLHTDVDVDGVGTTYIMKKALNAVGSDNHLLLINKDKVHGIQQKHVDYFKSNPVDFVIITDSSTNEVEIIKQFNCDVLVIDHHDYVLADKSWLNGKCNDGVHEYVIVNNTIKNRNQELDNKWLRSKNISAFDNLEEWIGCSDMSCGLVVYELMRLYCVCFANPKVLENMLLYQWAAITLFTDAINTLNDRNQWYLDNTVFSQELEPSLRIMMQSINKYKAKLDKSYINYSFAPIINKAIRAGKSNEVLDKVINSPSQIMDLAIYNKDQVDALNKATTVTVYDAEKNEYITGPRIFSDISIMLDISSLDVNPNYAGVIASRLSGDNSKNAVVYRVLENGLCKGSFRGLYQTVDYREYFEKYSSDIYAQGHPQAFGFELKYEQLKYLMDNIKDIEPVESLKPFITAGNMQPSEYGVYHITDMNEFKRLGYIWRIATGNSKVASKDEIVIRVKASDLVVKYTKGKLFYYDVLGIECKAFKPLSGDYFDIYVEYTNEINVYIR